MKVWVIAFVTTLCVFSTSSTQTLGAPEGASARALTIDPKPPQDCKTEAKAWSNELKDLQAQRRALDKKIEEATENAEKWEAAVDDTAVEIDGVYHWCKPRCLSMEKSYAQTLKGQKKLQNERDDLEKKVAKLERKVEQGKASNREEKKLEKLQSKLYGYNASLSGYQRTAGNMRGRLEEFCGWDE